MVLVDATGRRRNMRTLVLYHNRFYPRLDLLKPEHYVAGEQYLDSPLMLLHVHVYIA
jgi:hypothetical protein